MISLKNILAKIIKTIGPFQCVSMNIGYTSGESLLDKVQRAFYNSAMPYGKPFIAQVLSGAQYTMIGYWYTPNSSGWPVYGYCYIGNFDDFHFVRLDNGTWKITSQNAKSATTSVSVKVGAGPNQNVTISRCGKIRTLQFWYGNGTALGSGMSTETLIGSVNYLDNPISDVQVPLMARNTGAWASATYYPSVVLVVNTSGNIYIRGKPADLAQVQYMSGQVVWEVA